MVCSNIKFKSVLNADVLSSLLAYLFFELKQLILESKFGSLPFCQKTFGWQKFGRHSYDPIMFANSQ